MLMKRHLLAQLW